MSLLPTALSELPLMQSAVDIVNTSPHPVNKVAATLLCRDGTVISRTNGWPAPILDHFGMETDIGNSSGTLHAEVTCILAAAAIERACAGAALAVTDPPCPNCAKNIAEAGITAVYIDHKGFDKDFAARRGAEFDQMSMQIFKRAGITVYEVRRKEGGITPILEIAADYTPPNDSPVIVSMLDAMSDANFLDSIADARANLRGERFALALCHTPDGTPAALCSRAHLAIGYTKREDAPEFHDPHGKYSFILEPSNRVMMNAACLGYRIDPGYFYSSAIPTSRELVNLVGAGIKTLSIGDINDARDDDAKTALGQMKTSGIITVQT